MQYLLCCLRGSVFIICFVSESETFCGDFDLDGFQDLNNFESDPEEFARTFCRDMNIQDPEVGVRETNLLQQFDQLKMDSSDVDVHMIKQSFKKEDK